MSSIRDSFFDAKTAAALWDVAVSLKRGNALPLDPDSVFKSEQDLIAYIGDKITTTAYPGQIIAVVGSESTDIYYIDQNLDYHLIGKNIDIDNKSISNSDNGIELTDFSKALANQIPYKDESGKLVWKEICLRRDNDYNFNHINPTPQDGEILLVDTARDGLRIKCGDGETTYKDLSFIDDCYLKGYHKDNKFYTDSTLEIELITLSHKLYLDLSSNSIYYFDGETFVCTAGGSLLPGASATSAGVMKLYDTIGYNVDGTMTQKAITDELNDKFEIEVNLDEELLIFTN